MWPNKFSTKSEGREEKKKSIPSTESHSEPYFQSAVVLNTMTERRREWRAVHAGLASPTGEQMKEKTKKKSEDSRG